MHAAADDVTSGAPVRDGHPERREQASCLAVGLRAIGVPIALLLGACGGGGGGGGSTTVAPWVAGQFAPESTFAARCAAPRTGVDPRTGLPYPDRTGSVLAESNWLRSWTHDLYLWYAEVPDQDPASFTTPGDYFAVLKTTATTASGSPKDRFHFTYPTSTWESLSQSGVQPGYGAAWAVLSATVPRDVRVAYVEPGSPAASAPASLARGASVLAIDGVDMKSGTDSAKLNAGLYPASGMQHTFSILDPGQSSPRTVVLTAQDVAMTPVRNVGTIASASGPVGYLLFNDHVATAESELIAAFAQLKQAAVADLVLDIRYNGGGYLDIASEVAYMIAGPAATGQTFERQQFNDRYPTVNPVTGSNNLATPFHATSQGFSTATGQALPTLALPRVFVLTGATTCSASEAIVNGLLGVGVEVIQVGATTCGKPYGFYPADNCGTTWFSIQFRGVNAQGAGGYSDGFSPQNTATGTIGEALPGCSVADDFGHALGDPGEARLAAALGYRATATCPAPSAIAARMIRGRRATDAVVVKTPWLENRIARP